MEQKQFAALMTLIVPQVIALIAAHDGCDEITAAKKFYPSELYAALEDESTKLWHLSAPMLYQLFDEERRTGTITYPEEA